MNAKDAFHQTVHSAPGGCAALAVRLNMSPTILRNKANPNSNVNVVTIDDINRVMELTGDYSVLHAMASEHGFVCTKIDEQPPGDKAVLETATDIWATLGTLGVELNKALADGKIDPKEAKAIENAAFTMFRPVMQLVSRVNGMAEK